MSQSTGIRRAMLLVAVVVTVMAVAVALWRMGDDDGSAEPLAARPSTSSTPERVLTPAPSTVTEDAPKPKKKKAGPCEGPTTQFNVEGVKQDSLLPDCGTTPVTEAEQSESGLSLACGGSYPVILYKTTTSGAKTSICGKDASGVEFRLVTQARGGETIDLAGYYDPDFDTFVADQGDTNYAVQAYDGTLLVTEDGRTTSQKASDWISLDNESDYD